MNIATKAIDNVSSFITNKAFMLGMSGLLLAGAASAQKLPGLKTAPTPKAPSDTIHMKYMSTPQTKKDSLVLDRQFPVEKKKQKEDNGFWLFNMGANYSSKSLWNSGVQFSWGGEVPVGKYNSWGHRNVIMAAGYNVRDKHQEYGYNLRTPYLNASGYHYYKPSEVYLDFKLEPKIAIKNKNKTFNRAIIGPYIKAGIDGGAGSSTNEVTYMSPHVAAGVQLLVGRISTSHVDKHGEEKPNVPSLALNLFAEVRKQFLNNTTFGYNNGVYSPSTTERNPVSIQAGIKLAWLRNPHHH